MKLFLLSLLIVGTVIMLANLVGFILWPLGVVGFVFLKTKDPLKVYGSAFLLGVLNDVILGFPLGFTSSLLLVFGLGLFVVGVKFRADVRTVSILTVLFELAYIVMYVNISV